MIGELYDANNVVVGQAAVLIAPQGTALPVLKANVADPFDPTPFTAKTLTVAATTTYTISVGGSATTSLSTSSTAAQIQAALEALPTVGVGHAFVTGASSPYSIEFDSSRAGQVVTVTASTGTASLSGGLWTPVGATDQGWTYGTNKSSQTHSIEEQSTPVAQAITNQTVTIEGALSEDISRTIAISMNALLSQQAPGTGQPGYDKLVLTDDILYYAVCLVSQHFNGMPRWTYAPKWSQLSNVSVGYRRADAKRMYPVGFSTLCKPSEIAIYNFTAAGT